jgi:hypothetical protein
MRLTELLVASTVLAMASTSSLQMAATSATVQRGTLLQERTQQLIERDRLQLQAHWRLAVSSSHPCTTIAAELMRLAAQLPTPNGLRRELRATDDGGSLLVRWQSPEGPHLQRERLLSAVALGLCDSTAEAAAGATAGAAATTTATATATTTATTTAGSDETTRTADAANASEGADRIISTGASGADPEPAGPVSGVEP